MTAEAAGSIDYGQRRRKHLACITSFCRSRQSPEIASNKVSAIGLWTDVTAALRSTLRKVNGWGHKAFIGRLAFDQLEANAVQEAVWIAEGACRPTGMAYSGRGELRHMVLSKVSMHGAPGTPTTRNAASAPFPARSWRGGNPIKHRIGFAAGFGSPLSADPLDFLRTTGGDEVTALSDGRCHTSTGISASECGYRCFASAPQAVALQAGTSPCARGIVATMCVAIFNSWRGAPPPEVSTKAPLRSDSWQAMAGVGTGRLLGSR